MARVTSWTIEIECGEYDDRFAELLGQIANLRNHLIEKDIPHRYHEERTGRPAVERYSG